MAETTYKSQRGQVNIMADPAVGDSFAFRDWASENWRNMVTGDIYYCMYAGEWYGISNVNPAQDPKVQILVFTVTVPA